MTKLEALEIIRVRFEFQGGTGYAGWSEMNGQLCALGAVERNGGKGAFGGAVRTGLFRAHDNAVMQARVLGLEGIDESDTVPRAKIGTPAYDYVWKSLEAWATD